MNKLCAINGCGSKSSMVNKSGNIPMFNLPKNIFLQNKWLENIDSNDTIEKLKKPEYSICLKHFDERFINDDGSLLHEAYPTLQLKTGNTLIDYEELLSQNPQKKKKRGTSGLMNLQIARKKKLMRRDRMKKLAEQRRLAKMENGHKLSKKKSLLINCDRNGDFFLGDRTENESEKLVVSLRLTNMMQHLHDTKMTFSKHPSSIRDSKAFPTFNKIKNVQELMDNPVYWTTEQVLLFLEQFISQKGVTKRFEQEALSGEAILNLTKFDLLQHLKIDEHTSDMLNNVFQQLRKETIMRYVNS